MTRLCRFCRIYKPVDEFSDGHLCTVCASKGRGERAVVVTLQSWEMEEAALPEMRLPTDEQLAAGYEGELWQATKGDWMLEVRWRGDQAKFICRTLRISAPEHPTEARTFDYPHEVVDWIGVWATQLARAR